MANKDSELIFEKYTTINEDLGLGHGTPKMIRVTSIGSTTPLKRKVAPPVEDEMVFIQAGDEKEDQGDCGCDKNEGDNKGRKIYDGELDMARSELLKANEYSAKLFQHIGNHPDSDYLEGWVASKITKAADYLSSVFHYLDYEDNFTSKEPCYSDEEEPEDGEKDETVRVLDPTKAKKIDPMFGVG
jgi:hypothetical protein|tara:strand:+ start:682 stop:1239 length:558 start_codon:yes stop_codon:yes gene_type:complete